MLRSSVDGSGWTSDQNGHGQRQEGAENCDFEVHTFGHLNEGSVELSG